MNVAITIVENNKFSLLLSLLITDSTDALPLTNTPEVFGLNSNAEINYYSQATREIWNHLIELQPQTGEFFLQNPLYFASSLGKYFVPIINREAFSAGTSPRRKNVLINAWENLRATDFSPETARVEKGEKCLNFQLSAVRLEF